MNESNLFLALSNEKFISFLLESIEFIFSNISSISLIYLLKLLLLNSFCIKFNIFIQ